MNSLLLIILVIAIILIIVVYFYFKNRNKNTNQRDTSGQIPWTDAQLISGANLLGDKNSVAYFALNFYITHRDPQYVLTQEQLTSIVTNLWWLNYTDFINTNNPFINKSQQVLTNDQFQTASFIADVVGTTTNITWETVDITYLESEFALYNIPALLSNITNTVQTFINAKYTYMAFSFITSCLTRNQYLINGLGSGYLEVFQSVITNIVTGKWTQQQIYDCSNSLIGNNNGILYYISSDYLTANTNFSYASQDLGTIAYYLATKCEYTDYLNLTTLFQTQSNNTLSDYQISIVSSIANLASPYLNWGKVDSNILKTQLSLLKNDALGYTICASQIIANSYSYLEFSFFTKCFATGKFVIGTNALNTFIKLINSITYDNCMSVSNFVTLYDSNYQKINVNPNPINLKIQPALASFLNNGIWTTDTVPVNYSYLQITAKFLLPEITWNPKTQEALNEQMALEEKIAGEELKTFSLGMVKSVATLQNYDKVGSLKGLITTFREYTRGWMPDIGEGELFTLNTLQDIQPFVESSEFQNMITPLLYHLVPVSYSDLQTIIFLEGTTYLESSHTLRVRGTEDFTFNGKKIPFMSYSYRIDRDGPVWIKYSTTSGTSPTLYFNNEGGQYDTAVNIWPDSECTPNNYKFFPYYNDGRGVLVIGDPTICLNTENPNTYFSYDNYYLFDTEGLWKYLVICPVGPIKLGFSMPDANGNFGPPEQNFINLGIHGPCGDITPGNLLDTDKDPHPLCCMYPTGSMEMKDKNGNVTALVLTTCKPDYSILEPDFLRSGNIGSFNLYAYNTETKVIQKFYNVSRVVEESNTDIFTYIHGTLIVHNVTIIPDDPSTANIYIKNSEDKPTLILRPGIGPHINKSSSFLYIGPEIPYNGPVPYIKVSDIFVDTAQIKNLVSVKYSYQSAYYIVLIVMENVPLRIMSPANPVFTYDGNKGNDYVDSVLKYNNKPIKCQIGVINTPADILYNGIDPSIACQVRISWGDKSFYIHNNAGCANIPDNIQIFDNGGVYYCIIGPAMNDGCYTSRYIPFSGTPTSTSPPPVAMPTPSPTKPPATPYPWSDEQKSSLITNIKDIFNDATQFFKTNKVSISENAINCISSWIQYRFDPNNVPTPLYYKTENFDKLTDSILNNIAILYCTIDTCIQSVDKVNLWDAMSNTDFPGQFFNIKNSSDYNIGCLKKYFQNQYPCYTQFTYINSLYNNNVTQPLMILTRFKNVLEGLESCKLPTTTPIPTTTTTTPVPTTTTTTPIPTTTTTTPIPLTWSANDTANLVDTLNNIFYNITSNLQKNKAYISDNALSCMVSWVKNNYTPSTFISPISYETNASILTQKNLTNFLNMYKQFDICLQKVDGVNLWQTIHQDDLVSQIKDISGVSSKKKKNKDIANCVINYFSQYTYMQFSFLYFIFDNTKKKNLPNLPDIIYFSKLLKKINC